MGKCRMCCLQKPLVKAHVIPEAFFRPLRDEQQAPRIYTAGIEPPKRAPIGIYDETILCKDCEKKFDAIDSYGAQVLLSGFDHHFSRVEHADRFPTFESESVDQEKLLRFLIAVLWRASVSTHSFYEAVALGPLEDSAAATIDEPQDNIPLHFGAMLVRWVSTPEFEDAAKAIGNPSIKRIDKVKVYQFHFGNVVALIKASSSSFQGASARMCLCAQEKLSILGPHFESSGTLKSMINTAKASFAAYPFKDRMS